MTRILITFIVAFSISSCNIQDHGRTNKKDAFSAFHILDSTQAAEIILLDTIGHFFETITPIDMGIQLHTSIQGKSRDELLTAYKKGLQEEVTNFSKEENAFLTAIMVQALQMCSNLNKKLIPNQINLIKVKGDQYGDGVFYTRQKSIIIPANELEDRDPKKLLTVMIHELAHIMTRYHPALKDSLYATIGFHPIINDKPWAEQDAITSRFLTNPDGIGRNYTITLHTRSGQEIEAMPIIRSNFPDFSPENPQFLSYLGFDLFPIIEADGQKMFGVKPDGSSLHPMSEVTDFFTQIKDNTDYIIHPDEIIADNFMILLLAHSKKAEFSLQNYSPEGQALLAKMTKILGEYKAPKVD